MATRRPISVCWFCQPRVTSISHPHAQSSSKRRRNTTLAVRLSSEMISLPPFSQASQAFHNEIRADPNFKNQEDAAADFDSLVEMGPMRIGFLEKLPNASLPKPAHRRLSSKPAFSLPLAGPIAHATFREHLIAISRVGPGHYDKPIRKLLRHQLLHCVWPKEIYRIFAVAMQKEQTSTRLATLHEPLIRAIYRCRTNVDDSAVLNLIGCIVSRFRYAGLPVAEDLIILGVKFAARTRSIDGMKRYLRQLRERNITLNSGRFRAVIAKCSIGRNGLGEIRNGRWQRDDLLQVMHGFKDCRHICPDRQFHLSTFMDRNDWQYLHGWIAILARCRDIDTIWKEWQMWKSSDARRKPKRLASMHKLMTSKVRGDHCFIEQFALSGGHREAWTIINESDIEYKDLNERTRLSLLDAIELVPHHDKCIQQTLLQKCTVELEKIELALGVEWAPTYLDGRGSFAHKPIVDLEVALERLTEPDWKLEQDFGYPYASVSDAERSREKALHSAEERGLASEPRRAQTGGQDDFK